MRDSPESLTCNTCRRCKSGQASADRLVVGLYRCAADDHFQGCALHRRYRHGPRSVTPTGEPLTGHARLDTYALRASDYLRGPDSVRLISDLRTPLSLLAGALSDLFVYAMNVYGFTTVFPWFEAVAAHVAFGIAAAGV